MCGVDWYFRIHPYINSVYIYINITGSKVRPSPFPEVPTKRQMQLHLFTPDWARWSWASQLIGPWANWMAWAIVATVGGRLNDCKNFKTTLVGCSGTLCCFPNRIYIYKDVQLMSNLLIAHIPSEIAAPLQPGAARKIMEITHNWMVIMGNCSYLISNNTKYYCWY